MVVRLKAVRCCCCDNQSGGDFNSPPILLCITDERLPMISSPEARYQLCDNGEFVITGYNRTKLFSSFLPGIAGKGGIPMWLFYVNRGQCVCSMGVENKQHSIMEFLPANLAYQMVSTQGFRTFLRFEGDGHSAYYEPFQDRLATRDQNRIQRMKVQAHELLLEEENQDLGLKIRIRYFTLPGESCAALVRRLELCNTSERTIRLSGLDGLPMITPHGVNNDILKNMRRTIEAFIEVRHQGSRVPFFRGKVEADDRPDVERITAGNFYMAFTAGEGASSLLPVLVDPERIFGFQSDLSYPERFLEESIEDLLEGQQMENRLPCAMAPFSLELDPDDSWALDSIIGHAPDYSQVEALVARMLEPGAILKAADANREIVERITQKGLIASSEPALDHYTRQNFLDNTLRGGLPVSLGKSGRTLHLFSRKHGDLERDYNDFLLRPTPWSQGNGNYRDVNQNRRSDLFLDPKVGDTNILDFYSLTQLDGYNPLVIGPTRWILRDPAWLKDWLGRWLEGASPEDALELFVHSFTPGDLLKSMNLRGMKLRGKLEDRLGELADACDTEREIHPGEGFWIDHWTYNLDLIENYLAVFPEDKLRLFFNERACTFYDNPHVVHPRARRLVSRDGRVMQLGSVYHDEEKQALIESRPRNRDKVRTGQGRGEVYHTSLINVILCQMVNKLATFDPSGTGIEMEADKPGWYDALNGLPGLLGSSTCETFELKRHLSFLAELLECDGVPESWPLFAELFSFVEELTELLESRQGALDYWRRANGLKEQYREATRFGVTGQEKSLEKSRLLRFVLAALTLLDEAVERSWLDEHDLPATYFINTLESAPADPLTVYSASQRPLPLFLEGPVHYLRCQPGREKARRLLKQIEKSELFDAKLGMFKVNASLEKEGLEIGRCRVFSPGWLENESIWLHMEYKFMLELLRNGLVDEFYGHFRQVFVPFMKPDIYGRSILENSSFIASSANPDDTIHGSGFVARLSGATAEFIHILNWITTGGRPFRLNEKGELLFQLRPLLPGWLFRKEAGSLLLHNGQDERVEELPANSFSFMLFGETLITLVNPDRRDTWNAEAPLLPKSWLFTDHGGRVEEQAGEFPTSEASKRLRAGEWRSLKVMLG